jgi:hypothetical protein
MAESVVNVECKIVDTKQIPNTKKQIVSVEFTLGERKWFKAFRLEYDRPISMEEFKRELARVGIFPEAEEDFLAYVKEEADKPFTIQVERGSSEPAA